MKHRRNRYLKWLLIAVGVLGLFAVGVLLLVVDYDSFGVSAEGDRLTRIEQSLNYEDGKFVNQEAVMDGTDGSIFSAAWEYGFGEDNRTPPGPLPMVAITRETFAYAPIPKIIWLGHSTVMIVTDSVRLLLDPVFDHLSQLLIGSADRFQPAPISREQLPAIDAVIISHDHYDHLEKATILHLAKSGTLFFVPLGVGAYLEAWLVPVEQIVELDWWEMAQVGTVDLVCTPARHFSGRGVFKMNETLWATWVIAGADYRIYYGGDTGYSDLFKEVGRKYGPFDMTIMPIGAYGDAWPDIHTTPEQAVAAHIDLMGKTLLPTHWGSYDLALHSWDEPIRRLVIAAAENDIQIVTPRMGRAVLIGEDHPDDFWWLDIE